MHSLIGSENKLMTLGAFRVNFNSRDVVRGLDRSCRQLCMFMLFFCVTTVMFLGRAYASEGGGAHYPSGVNTIMNGALPAPGETMMFNYFQYYESTRLNDSHGRSLDPDFKLNVAAWAPRFAHTWENKVGPFFLASAISLPMTRVDVRAFGRHQVSTGMGDPTLSPLLFYYVNPAGNFFAYFGPDIWVPVGEYDKDRIANNGLNYWSVSPNVMLTWLPSSRWEISGTIYSEFNAENKATNYRSGNSVTVDGAVGYRPFSDMPELKFALQGFALKQFTDDKVDNVSIPGGNRAQALGLGPQISYDILGGKGGVMVKYQREFAVENRSEGNKFWVEVVFPL